MIFLIDDWWFSSDTNTRAESEDMNEVEKPQRPLLPRPTIKPAPKPKPAATKKPTARSSGPKANIHLGSNLSRA